jgi:hypothetical protein
MNTLGSHYPLTDNNDKDSVPNDSNRQIEFHPLFHSLDILPLSSHLNLDKCPGRSAAI